MKDQTIQGDRVSLRPATPQDRRAIYEWLAESDLTADMMGPPAYPDHPPPSWDQFCTDYLPHFFDGSQPTRGRCFVIMVGDRPVGQINHDRIDQQRRRTELDIWMSCQSNCNNGYGSDALRTLCRHLHEAFGVNEFLICPSARNARAIRAYEKSGFQRLPITPAQKEQFGPFDYHDCVVLVKRISSSS